MVMDLQVIAHNHLDHNRIVEVRVVQIAIKMLNQRNRKIILILNQMVMATADNHLNLILETMANNRLNQSLNRILLKQVAITVNPHLNRPLEMAIKIRTIKLLLMVTMANLNHLKETKTMVKVLLVVIMANLSHLQEILETPIKVLQVVAMANLNQLQETKTMVIVHHLNLLLSKLNQLKIPLLLVRPRTIRLNHLINRRLLIKLRPPKILPLSISLMSLKT